MSGGDLLRQFGWAPGIALALLLLPSRAIMRRLGQGATQRQSDRDEDRPAVDPEGFHRVRRQFILTLTLLAIIVVVSILTHLQSP